MNKAIIKGSCTILLESKEHWKRLGKIFFLKDNSVCFAFPKMMKGGLLAESECLNTSSITQRIDLTRQGKVTKEAVKFTYHSDGDVHFSMDGKIYTRIRMKVLPLSTNERHLFSCVYANFAHANNLLEEQYGKYSKLGCLRIHSLGEEPSFLNISVHLLPVTKINLCEYQKSNYMILISDDFSTALKVVVAPTQFTISSLKPTEVSPVDPMIFFCGGFMTETTKIRFLSAVYPAGGLENLIKVLGTVDIIE